MRKVTFEEALERFASRDDIILCEDGWNGWKVKSKFFDKILNEEWWSVPCSVHQGNRVSEKRKGDKVKKTNLKKYGVESYAQTDECKLKAKQTNLKKYGKPNYRQTNECKNKYRKTCLVKYGVEHYSKSDEYKQKIIDTNLNKHGVEHYFQTCEFKEKLKQTNLEKHGVERFNQTNEWRQKTLETNLKKYGVNHSSQNKQIKEKTKNTHINRYGGFPFQTMKWKKKVSNRFINETGEHLKAWLAKQSRPKPSYTSFVQHTKNETISLAAAEMFVNNYRDSKTTLEVLAEKLFESSHFNSKASEKINYRPDFKLSEEIFINADGLFWHCDLHKGKNYHFQMRKDFEQEGLRLFQFYSSELISKPEIVKSIVYKSLGKMQNKIFAENCTCEPVNNSEAKTFLENNHLEGNINAKHLGLYFNGEIVSLVSFNLKKRILTIERFCSKINTEVTDSLDVLLGIVLKNNQNISEINKWTNLRYEDESCFRKEGFVISCERLGYKWTDGHSVFDFLCNNCTSQKKFHKIYNAGERLWVKKLL